MKYIVDNDLHIHTYLSPCSGDPEQNTENILRYAKETGLRDICITDHYWDPKVPGATTFLAQLHTDLLKKALPLPTAEGVNFYFGCETELDKYGHLGIHPDTYDEFDFIVIPINHFHQQGFSLPEEEYNNVPVIAKRWVERFHYVLDQPLPYHKVGMAHLTCELMATEYRTQHLEVVDLIPDTEYYTVFKRASEKGVGIELNFETFFDYSEEELERLMRPYRIAKDCSCKFYCGTDAHHPADFLRMREKFDKVANLIGLQEEDKYRITKG